MAKKRAHLTGGRAKFDPATGSLFLPSSKRKSKWMRSGGKKRKPLPPRLPERYRYALKCIRENHPYSHVFIPSKPPEGETESTSSIIYELSKDVLAKLPTFESVIFLKESGRGILNLFRCEWKDLDKVSSGKCEFRLSEDSTEVHLCLLKKDQAEILASRELEPLGELATSKKSRQDFAPRQVVRAKRPAKKRKKR